MSFTELLYKSSFSLLVWMVAAFIAPSATFCQTQKLGIIQYTPPKGWNKTTRENIVAFSQLNEATGKFCIITLYGATPGTGDPESDFRREWNNLVVKPLNAEENPTTETETADGWTAIAGGATVQFQGSKAVALLTVISGGRTTVSILSVFNDESYTAQLTSFSSSIELEKAVSEIPAQQLEESRPASSPNIAAMHASALVKEFELNELRAIQVYGGKRVRIHGTVNAIEIAKDGRIRLTFKSSISTYNNARCYFSKSEGPRVAALSAHEEATVEGTVRGWEHGFGGAKVFVLLEDCTVP